MDFHFSEFGTDVFSSEKLVQNFQENFSRTSFRYLLPEKNSLLVKMHLPDIKCIFLSLLKHSDKKMKLEHSSQSAP